MQRIGNIFQASSKKSGASPTKSLDMLKERMQAMLGIRMYSMLLRSYLRLANRDMRGRLQKNKTLKDSASGRCFILGNGPSINAQDLTILQNESIFTCNYYCDNNKLGNAIPAAHFITDERLFEGKEPPICETLRQCKLAGIQKLFLCCDAIAIAKDLGIEKDFDVFYLMQGAPMVSGKDYELDSILPSFETVIHSEILTAVYMGYSEIYLLGCDCTGFVTFANARQSEGSECVGSGYGLSISKEVGESIKSVMSRRPIAEDLRSYARIFDSYEMLLQYCDNRGVGLYNATMGGILECIPRKELSSLFQSPDTVGLQCPKQK